MATFVPWSFDRFAFVENEGRPMTSNAASSATDASPFNWTSDLGRRQRAPWLIFIKEKQIIAFAGESIPSVVTVVEREDRRRYTDYRLQLETGVRHISGLDGWGTSSFTEGLKDALKMDIPIDTWGDVAVALGVPTSSAQTFLRAWRPQAAEDLDEVERQLASLVEPTTNKTWSDQSGNRGCHAWLVLIKDDKIMRFEGRHIPGISTIRGKDYVQEGVWSRNIYRLVLAAGVRELHGHEGWNEATFAEGLRDAVPEESRGFDETWTGLAQVLGVSIESVQTFLRAWRPEESRMLDIKSHVEPPKPPPKKPGPQQGSTKEPDKPATPQDLAAHFGGKQKQPPRRR